MCNFTVYLELRTCNCVGLTWCIVRVNVVIRCLIEFNVSRLEQIKRSVFVPYSSNILSILFKYVVHIVSLLLGEHCVHFVNIFRILFQYCSSILHISFHYCSEEFLLTLINILRILLQYCSSILYISCDYCSGELCALSLICYKYCFNTSYILYHYCFL